jgi:hypothetical protein
MTIASRRRGQPGEETPFIELLFVTVGSLAMLMLIFLAAASRSLSMSACEASEPSDEVVLVREVKQWAEAVQGRATLTEQEVARRCAVPKDKTSLTTGTVPAKLARYCRPDQERIVSRAGLTWDQIGALGKREEVAARIALDCLVRQPMCPSLSEAELGQKAADVQKWLNEERAMQKELQGEAARLCGAQPSPPGAGEQGTNGVPLPSILYGLCQRDVEQILGRAKVTRADLASAAQTGRALSGAIARCDRGSEPITLDSTSLKFDVCSADTKAASDFFNKRAHEVVSHLGSHNRIDILGHSDQNRIASTGCSVRVKVSGKQDIATYQVFTNEMLSWLRANAVRDALVEAIEQDPTLEGFRRRLNEKRVRIYTIGVGDAEPLGNLDDSRRIEIRFATDNRSSALRSEP